MKNRMIDESVPVAHGVSSLFRLREVAMAHDARLRATLSEDEVEQPAALPLGELAETVAQRTASARLETAAS